MVLPYEKTGRGWRLLLALPGLLGCGGPADDAPRAGRTDDVSAGVSEAPSTEAMAGTPPGGLRDWVADIRSGLAELPSLVMADATDSGADRPAAETMALDLYLGRQEYIERYYGAGGVRAGGEALAATVHEAESRFHEVLRLAGAKTRADTTALRTAIDHLSAALDRVLLEAEAAGVPLDPPRGVRSGKDEASDGSGSADGAGGSGTAVGLPAATLASIRSALPAIESAFTAGRTEEARRQATRLYLDRYEPLEVQHGPGSEAPAHVVARVAEAEAAFHALLRSEGSGVADAVRALDTALAAAATAIESGPSAAPPGFEDPGELAYEGAGRAGQSREDSERGGEISRIRDALAAARSAFESGDATGALAIIESTYLDRFEPLEPRLAASQVHRIERLFHLELRPEVANGESAERVAAAFAALDRELARAEATMEGRAPFWFGAFNAFAIIVREGLEAALLIAAILAYLAGVSADSRHRRLVYAGALVGVAASFATWGVARSLISVSGAARELLEGVTALLAVAVLLYVSHWLFHKSYVVDWTRYLRDGVGRAISKGSALAMATLAFAAVYREGFETVLFYQALSFETGPTAVMAGFLPGLVLIGGVGIGIVRMGIRLPMRRLFAITNAVLLYLAFSFLGKGLYALQEAGWYAASPVSWMPDRAVLRQVFGLYPVAQILAAQATFLVLLGLTYAYYRWRSSKSELGRRGGAAAMEADARITGEAAALTD